MHEQSPVGTMKNGAGFELHLCVEPGSAFTPQHLREALKAAMKQLSAQSLWLRFASPVHELSERQLDQLTDLDGHDRLAWCAVTSDEEEARGIGLARYVRLPDQPEVAEFAVTVVDAFQGQGVGTALLEQLILSARQHGIARLRGYLTPGNQRMLALCRKLNATVVPEQGFLRADIVTAVPPA